MLIYTLENRHDKKNFQFLSRENPARVCISAAIQAGSFSLLCVSSGILVGKGNLIGRLQRLIQSQAFQFNENVFFRLKKSHKMYTLINIS